mmetsp:Transcript_33570/g.104596  ORF Transcript_33570/g.104596 Transcript_33570/m.104596 type:complete len:239 (+) Transcript_33570:598-1314(+)
MGHGLLLAPDREVLEKLVLDDVLRHPRHQGLQQTLTAGLGQRPLGALPQRGDHAGLRCGRHLPHGDTLHETVGQVTGDSHAGVLMHEHYGVQQRLEEGLSALRLPVGLLPQPAQQHPRRLLHVFPWGEGLGEHEGGQVAALDVRVPAGSQQRAPQNGRVHAVGVGGGGDARGLAAAVGVGHRDDALEPREELRECGGLLGTARFRCTRGDAGVGGHGVGLRQQLAQVTAESQAELLAH